MKKNELSSEKLPSYPEQSNSVAVNYFKTLIANAMTLPVIETPRLFEEGYSIEVSSNEKQFIKHLISNGIIYKGTYEPKIGAAVIELIEEFVSERKPLLNPNKKQNLMQLMLKCPGKYFINCQNNHSKLIIH